MHEKASHWGKGAPRWRTSETTRRAPYRWNKNPFLCNVCGKPFEKLNGSGTHYANCWHNDQASYHRARVFLGSLMDILDDDVPIEWLAEALQTVNACKELDFLFVTKRPELWAQRMRDVVAWEHEFRGRPAFADLWLRGQAPANVWMITSTENQKRADERIPHLLRIPAAVHGLSCEPLLSPINLGLNDIMRRAPKEGDAGDYSPVEEGPIQQIDWVIAGGESGPSARPMDVIWMEEIQRQCLDAQIPYFAKQLGSYAYTENANLHDWPDGTRLLAHGSFAAGARISLKNKKGENMAEWPEELRVRQWPQSATRTQ